MKVYLVKMLVNDEHGDYDVDCIFLSKEKAQKYVEEMKQEDGEDFYKDVWFRDEPLEEYIIEEWEVIE